MLQGAKVDAPGAAITASTTTTSIDCRSVCRTGACALLFALGLRRGMLHERGQRGKRETERERAARRMCKLESRCAAAVVAGFAVKWKFANVYLFVFSPSLSLSLVLCLAVQLAFASPLLPLFGSVLGLCKRSMNWERNSSGKLSRNVIFPYTQRAKRRLSFSSRSHSQVARSGRR